ncbi:hypothetical protein NECAME_02297 [Necator americanus]|uniref:Uncharacterized protein n=1 Tax=Necator americanus TaxID=51031 RepID=W2TGE7_NECAM|nr:hypothetical protein NECAME_02297 [Necator americanus]ETN80898.1 hypothetical protein NECAME_02297 [Necator americanus]
MRGALFLGPLIASFLWQQQYSPSYLYHCLSTTPRQDHLDTAKSDSTIEEEEALRISPLPFILVGRTETVLSLENLHASEWISLRALVSSPNSYSIRPQRVIIPPLRSSTISIQLLSDVDLPSAKEPGLLLQWFTIGENHLCVDVTRLWQRPYLVPRSNWKFYVLPIYHESVEDPRQESPLSASMA